MEAVLAASSSGPVRGLAPQTRTPRDGMVYAVDSFRCAPNHSSTAAAGMGATGVGLLGPALLIVCIFFAARRQQRTRLR